MFTGLIEALAVVREIQTVPPGLELVVSTPPSWTGLRLGESIAVNGVCLTVVEPNAEALRFQVGPETIRLTNLGNLSPGQRVNVERALRLGDPVGGHFVQGHVDGVGEIAFRERQADWEMVWFRSPESLMPLIVPKGSIAVDGVSLTVVSVDVDRFSVALIPHTLAQTTLGFKSVGAPVNLETDLLGKHVVRYLQAMGIAGIASQKIVAPPLLGQ